MIITTVSAMKTTPPMTPPTIAPGKILGESAFRKSKDSRDAGELHVTFVVRRNSLQVTCVYQSVKFENHGYKIVKKVKYFSIVIIGKNANR